MPLRQLPERWGSYSLDDEMTDAVWHYAVGNEQRGPIGEAELAVAIGRGEIGPETLVWREGMQGWAAARTALPGNLVPQSWVDSLPPMAGMSVGASGTFGQAGQSGAAYAQHDGGTGGYFHPTSFGDVIKTVLNRYVQFSGRARRSEYWYWVLFIFVVNIGINLIVGFSGGEGSSFFALILALVLFIFSLGVLLPHFAVTARRLHDTGRSGWWQLVQLIPLIGFILMIYWCTRPGEPTDNQYGPA